MKTKLSWLLLSLFTVFLLWILLFYGNKSSSPSPEMDMNFTYEMLSDDVLASIWWDANFCEDWSKRLPLGQSCDDWNPDTQSDSIGQYWCLCVWIPSTCAWWKNPGIPGDSCSDSWKVFDASGCKCIVPLKDIAWFWVQSLDSIDTVSIQDVPSEDGQNLWWTSINWSSGNMDMPELSWCDANVSCTSVSISLWHIVDWDSPFDIVNAAWTIYTSWVFYVPSPNDPNFNVITHDFDGAMPTCGEQLFVNLYYNCGDIPDYRQVCWAKSMPALNTMPCWCEWNSVVLPTCDKPIAPWTPCEVTWVVTNGEQVQIVEEVGFTWWTDPSSSTWVISSDWCTCEPIQYVECVATKTDWAACTHNSLPWIYDASTCSCIPTEIELCPNWTEIQTVWTVCNDDITTTENDMIQQDWCTCEWTTITPECESIACPRLAACPTWQSYSAWSDEVIENWCITQCALPWPCVCENTNEAPKNEWDICAINWVSWTIDQDWCTCIKDPICWEVWFDSTAIEQTCSTTETYNSNTCSCEPCSPCADPIQCWVWYKQVNPTSSSNECGETCYNFECAPLSCSEVWFDHQAVSSTCTTNEYYNDGTCSCEPCSACADPIQCWAWYKQVNITSTSNECGQVCENFECVPLVCGDIWFNYAQANDGSTCSDPTTACIPAPWWDCTYCNDKCELTTVSEECGPPPSCANPESACDFNQTWSYTNSVYDANNCFIWCGEIECTCVETWEAPKTPWDSCTVNGGYGTIGSDWCTCEVICPECWSPAVVTCEDYEKMTYPNYVAGGGMDANWCEVCPWYWTPICEPYVCGQAWFDSSTDNNTLTDCDSPEPSCTVTPGWSCSYCNDSCQTVYVSELCDAVECPIVDCAIGTTKTVWDISYDQNGCQTGCPIVECVPMCESTNDWPSNADYCTSNWWVFNYSTCSCDLDFCENWDVKQSSWIECNDWDRWTENDVIQLDGCTCEWTGIIIPIEECSQLNCPQYEACPSGQSYKNWTSATYSFIGCQLTCSDPWICFCSNSDVLPQAPWTSCNDWNSNTSNDVILSDGCTCAWSTVTQWYDLSINKELVTTGPYDVWDTISFKITIKNNSTSYTVPSFDLIDTITVNYINLLTVNNLQVSWDANHTSWWWTQVGWWWWIPTERSTIHTFTNFTPWWDITITYDVITSQENTWALSNVAEIRIDASNQLDEDIPYIDWNCTSWHNPHVSDYAVAGTNNIDCEEVLIQALCDNWVEAQVVWSTCDDNNALTKNDRIQQDWCTCSWKVYEWYTSDFTQCSANCWWWTQTRVVACDYAWAQISESYCTEPKPVKTQECNTQACETYDWYTWEFNECTKLCGGGTTARTVQCRKYSDNTVVDDSMCNGAKPSGTESCNSHVCETYEWNVETRSSCDAVCGWWEKSRVVTCHRMSDYMRVNDTYCEEFKTKPDVLETCNEDACKAYNWVTRDWNQCTKTCGWWEQTRVVECIDDSGYKASDSLCTWVKPETYAVCNEQSCDTYNWVEGERSACSELCGWWRQVRDVDCLTSTWAKVSDDKCVSIKLGTQRSCNTSECQVITSNLGGWWGWARITDYCWDWEVNQKSEECDDGNFESEDGCSKYCRNEWLELPIQEEEIVEAVVEVEPEVEVVVESVCWDGDINQSSEQCDDGNLRNSDGCDSSCIIEQVKECGDGIKNQSSEECDDGNMENWDGCSNACIIELDTTIIDSILKKQEAISLPNYEPDPVNFTPPSFLPQTWAFAKPLLWMYMIIQNILEFISEIF